MKNTEDLFHYLGESLGWENDREGAYTKYGIDLFLTPSGVIHVWDINEEDYIAYFTNKDFNLSKLAVNHIPLIHRIQTLLQNYGKTPLEIAEEVCDRIGIIQEGHVIAVGTMKELKERTGSEAKKLESVFFKLTGEEVMEEVIQALKF